MSRSFVSSRVSWLSGAMTREFMKMMWGVPELISLTAGEPDFKTPEHIIEVAKRALDEGFTHYTPTGGIPELLEAIAEKLSRENGVDYDPEREIMCVPGTQEAVFITLFSTIDPGDEVILTDPTYLAYASVVMLCGGKPVSVPVTEEEGFRIDVEELEKKITDKTKLLILNTPNNPTGAVYTRSTLEAIADVAQRHDLLVISDEIYEKIIYDGAEHVSFASLPNMKERTITINGFSKAYAMTGWRIGYVAAPSQLIEKMMAANGYIIVCPNSIAQRAAHAALTGPQDCVEEMVKEFDRRRKVIVQGINEIEGIHCFLPKGAFYAWVNIKETGLSSFELTFKLFQEAKVGVLPGSAFGAQGEGYLRISYAASMDSIERALERIKPVIERVVEEKGQ
ncbi:pyridoxal phosphate-dependent aminotransferase [Candidatus Bathyarchaeota archaeon]|nr:MAG: pyridoxal phosphate-dependent aminotransferase [Candidatus Bathyarchaeota archaeon]RLI33715.1 MAG: pyridoxal phosphate-dependent aminotransferase [Candidatus Bathyarchaeota archaeon]